MSKIKRGDMRLYYDGEEIKNVEILSVRRTKKDGRDGIWYKIKFIPEKDEKRNGYGYKTDLEVRVWQADRADFVNLW